MNIHKVSGSLTNAVFFISYPMADHSESASSTIVPPTVLLRIYGPSSGNLISRKKELHVLNTLSAVYRIGPAILGTFSNGRVEEYFESRALYKEELREPRTSRWIARRMRELHRVDLAMMELLPDQPAPSASQQQQQQMGDQSSASTVSEESTLGRQDSMTADGLSRRSSEYAESFTSSNGGSKSPPHRPYARPYQPHHHQSSSTTPLHSAYNGSTTTVEHSQSGLSQLSTSSTSSIFSYSSSHSSNGSSSSYLNSPYLRARRSIDTKPGVSEGVAPPKKRSLSSIKSRLEFSLESLIGGPHGHIHGHGRASKKPRSVVWQNIENWTKEARKVLKRVDKLEKALASSSISTSPSSSISNRNAASGAGSIVKEVNPLLAPSLLVECKKLLDLHKFAKEVRRYGRYIEKWEVQNGKSKRVFGEQIYIFLKLIRVANMRHST
jgi:choline kinase